MQNRLIKKGLIFGVIILFIISSVVPSIGGNYLKNNDDSNNDDFEHECLTKNHNAILSNYFEEFEEANDLHFEESDILYKNSNVNIQYKNKESYPFERGNTLNVGGSGMGNYSTIQGAVYDATDGDTVFVYDYSSPYYENVIIDKSINLIGENRDTTIIDAGGSGDVIQVSVDWVNITGFTVINSGGWSGGYPKSGIVYENSQKDIQNCYLGNTNVSNNYYGVYLYYSSNITIEDNIMSSNEAQGIRLYSSCWNNISNNILTNNSHGLLLYFSSNNNTISGNNITMNNAFGIRISDPGYCYDNIIYNNYFNNTNNAADSGINAWNISKTDMVNGEDFNIIGGEYFGGNYWHDYIGVDNTGDGLGDTNIPYGPGDYLPLTTVGYPVHNLHTGEGFLTIQAAIDDPDTNDNPGDHDTIYVESAYSEHVLKTL